MTALLTRPVTDPPADSRVDPPATIPARRGAALAVLFAIVTLLIAVFSGSGTPAVPGAGRLERGSLEVFRAASWALLEPGDVVTTGARVRSADGARIDVTGGQLELGVGTNATFFPGAVELATGSMLTSVTSPREVRANGATVEGVGVWRVDLASSPRVAVYDGGVGVLGTVDVAVGRLEQAALRTDDTRARPMRIDPADGWDARFAAEVIAVDRFAASSQVSLGRTYGADVRERAFYDDFDLLGEDLQDALPSLAVRRSDTRFGPPDQIILGAAVAQVLIDFAGIEPAAAVAAVDLERGDGASWGTVLVRRDQGVAALRIVLDQALRDRAVAAVGRGDVPQPSGPGTASPGPGPGPGPSPGSRCEERGRPP